MEVGEKKVLKLQPFQECSKVGCCFGIFGPKTTFMASHLMGLHDA